MESPRTAQLRSEVHLDSHDGMPRATGGRLEARLNGAEEPHAKRLSDGSSTVCGLCAKDYVVPETPVTGPPEHMDHINSHAPPPRSSGYFL